MSTRLFDLNIEEVLENWEVPHAIREVISNALDEQVLSSTEPIQIFKDSTGAWHIRDFGRGLHIEHFTLNENKEKLSHAGGIIGKFGVGLKDALATFHRREITLLINSSHGTFQLRATSKHDFTNIITLHVEYDDTPTALKGTDWILTNASDQDVAAAKSMFLKFSGEEILETTQYGEIIRCGATTSRVYITGVVASEEPGFLFSYNVTSLTPAMKKRLNRERLNVGRTTYADRIKMILKEVKSPVVRALLVDQLLRRATGTQCDEMQWLDISQLAMNWTHEARRVAFVTEHELQSFPDVIDNMRRDQCEVLVISDAQKAKLSGQVEAGGPSVRTIDVYAQEYNESFQYRVVDRAALTKDESQIVDQTDTLLGLVGLDRATVPQIKISETMRITMDNTGGVWDSADQTIYILRTKLCSLTAYAATLLHEVAHASTGHTDVTREFETVLTEYLGRTATVALRETAAPTLMVQRSQQTRSGRSVGQWWRRITGRMDE